MQYKRAEEKSREKERKISGREKKERRKWKIRVLPCLTFSS